ncbi:MAG: bifunctional diaminohydroxyphosphoribosylaminopyrimidine deaminase/5-amino-6-(5-phosphoribosylamino)uracil reductase RibD [Phycisphaerae bacterium]|jgi:diaminohydroxyphosphoribosylaminopyrimidine deaminase/5-amino-6-(5-phosphoribosylamino)uracil reductase
MNDGGRDDVTFMRRALALAERGRGRVEPNPMVGCVIVRGGRIVGEGYHRKFGGPHAEIEALRIAGRRARGATVYVTLEPCCYHGKTPPCTEALKATGVGRVVAGGRDPNPRVAGCGLRLLRQAGIAVEAGVLEEEATALVAPFAKLIRRRRPWVILKWAQSLDGKIATRTGDARWISDETQRAHAHRVRGVLDAIIVGRRTAERDDPMLTCRVGRSRRIATRIVLDTRLRTPRTATLVRTADKVPTWLFCAENAPKARREALAAAGCRVWPVPVDTGGGVSLERVLDVLGEQQMTNVLVEGGGLLLGNLLDQGLADEVHIYIANRLIGGRGAPGPLDGMGPTEVRDALRLPANTKLRTLGSGWLVQARLSPAPTRATARRRGRGRAQRK